MNKALAHKKRTMLSLITGDLMTGEKEGTPKGTALEKIPLALIKEERNIRSAYDDENLLGLAESLKAHGLLQPITVSENQDGYTILYGHRRFRAAELAGWTEIACIIQKQFSDEVERIITQTIENEEREEVPPRDKERAVLKLETEHGLAIEQICKRFGKSRGWYSQIKGAQEFREQYGNLFEDAGIPLYTKEAYKMKGYTKEQVEQVIKNLKSGSSKARVLGEGSDGSKQERMGRKLKQKGNIQGTETADSKEGFEVKALDIGDESIEIATHIRLHKNRTFTVHLERTGNPMAEQFINPLRETLCSYLAALGFSDSSGS